jgi:hypothetical protein
MGMRLEEGSRSQGAEDQRFAIIWDIGGELFLTTFNVNEVAQTSPAKILRLL